MSCPKSEASMAVTGSQSSSDRIAFAEITQTSYFLGHDIVNKYIKIYWIFIISLHNNNQT